MGLQLSDLRLPSHNPSAGGADGQANRHSPVSSALGYNTCRILWEDSSPDPTGDVSHGRIRESFLEEFFFIEDFI